MSQVIVKTYSTSGTFTWTAPLDVTSVKVECWGGGGAGGGATANNNGGGGGAGGQYAVKTALAVTGGNSYSIVVAATKAGTTGNGTAGNDSTFNSTDVVAKGGAGGTGNNGAGGTGSTTGGVGDTVNRGGSGSAGAASTRSGGGGGGAGSTGNGGDTTASTTGGTGTTIGGGNGGTGLASGSNANGGNGSSFGGGGAGAYRTTTTSRSGGTGAAGQVQITYTTSDVDIYNVATGTGSGASVTVSTTVPSGYTNTGLLVGVSNFATLDTNAPIDTVKFGGVSLTSKVAQAGIATTEQSVSWWYLDSPTASTANVVVTPHGSSGGMAVCVIPLINVSASEVDNSNSGTQAVASTANVAVTTIADRCIVFSVAELQTGSSGPTPSSPQITLFNPDITDIFSYTTAKTPAGSVTHTYSNGAATDNWSLAIVSISPLVVSGGANSSHTMMTGMGM